MSPLDRAYEVWKRTVKGGWGRAEGPAGETSFGKLKDAQRVRDSILNDASVMETAIVQRSPVESVPGAGAKHAARMGLLRPNVHIEGVKIGPDLSRRFGP